MTTTITTVSANGSSLDVEWSDGEKSSFNFFFSRMQYLLGCIEKKFRLYCKFFTNYFF